MKYLLVRPQMNGLPVMPHEYFSGMVDKIGKELKEDFRVVGIFGIDLVMVDENELVDLVELKAEDIDKYFK
jgi:hypothetical protein